MKKTRMTVRAKRWRRPRLRRWAAAGRCRGCARAQGALQGGRKILTHPEFKRRARPGQSRFLPIASPATLAGSTAHFRVYFANVLGQPGAQIAQGVLKNCEADYQKMAAFFAQDRSLQFNVILAPLSHKLDGTAGAEHLGCRGTDLYCDVQITPEINPAVSSALVVAEAVEVFEAIQNRGWDCGGSNGEGLSRVLASELYPNVLEALGYASAGAWLRGRRPNLVNRTLQTDLNDVGNGCAVLFLNYLHSQLGFGWDKIAQAAAPTLAGTYRILTGKTKPFPDFRALLAKKFPPGQGGDLQTDNPFPINGAAPAPVAPTRAVAAPAKAAAAKQAAAPTAPPATAAPAKVPAAPAAAASVKPSEPQTPTPPAKAAAPAAAKSPVKSK
jgi:hypothetical protein